MEQKINKKRELLDFAKDLRRNMTKQERRLWYDYLRNYPIKIYKQRIIENYIADFYCHQAKLVIEIDGSQHYTEDGKIRDEERTLALQKQDLLVLRFTNGEVDNYFEGVCKMIDRTIKERVNGS